MVKKRQSSVVQFIKSLDSYGVPIQLTYEGETNHKTVRGGLVTLIASVYILYYSITQFTPVALNQISLF
jgi:hypothetical protein